MSAKQFLIAEDLTRVPELEAWRQEYVAASARTASLMQELGAKNVFAFRFQAPEGFSFPRGKQPEGWTKPRDSRGFSRPMRKNVLDKERIAGLAFPPSPFNLLQEIYDLPSAMNYKLPDGAIGHSALGGMFPFDLGWPGGKSSPIILITPDYTAVAADILKRHPDATLTWTCFRDEEVIEVEPAIPSGFRVISEAEVDLVYAQAKVNQERLEKDEEPDATPDLQM